MLSDSLVERPSFAPVHFCAFLIMHGLVRQFFYAGENMVSSRSAKRRLRLELQLAPHGAMNAA